MPKYLFVGGYSPQGVKGLAKEGGTGRRAAIAKLAESVGGKLDAVYFAFGVDDYYVILDLPDHAAAAAVSLAVNQTGTLQRRQDHRVDDARRDGRGSQEDD